MKPKGMTRSQFDMQILGGPFIPKGTKFQVERYNPFSCLDNTVVVYNKTFGHRFLLAENFDLGGRDDNQSIDQYSRNTE